MGVDAHVEIINFEGHDQIHPISLSVCRECADRFSVIRSAEFGNPPSPNRILQQGITHVGDCNSRSLAEPELRDKEQGELRDVSPRVTSAPHR